jgi:hypothetical protein
MRFSIRSASRCVLVVVHAVFGNNSACVDTSIERWSHAAQLACQGEQR